MSKLTEKQKMFCEEYLVDLNATQSAIRAGYSKDTAKEIGSQNLTKLNIQEYISELKTERLNRIKIEQDDVLKELYNWAFSDITETISLKPEEVKQLPQEVKRLITKFKETSKTYMDGKNIVIDSVIELHFVSKEKAMEMIAKHIGLFEKDNEQKKLISSEKVTINFVKKKK